MNTFVLVQRHGQALVDPGPTGMRENDLHVRKVDRDVVDEHRLAPFQPNTAAAAHAGAHARVARVKDRGQLVLRDHLVDRVGDAIGGIDVLHDAVEFEAAHAVPLDEIARLARAHPALARVDRGERDHDVGVLRRVLRDLVIAHALGADAALAVDRKETEGDLLRPVDLDDLRDLRPGPRRLEIARRRIEEAAHDRVLGIVARDLGMHVHVDRMDVGEVDHERKSPAGSGRHRGADLAASW